MKAALSIGVDAIFAEVHPNPDTAPCDGPNMLYLDDLEEVLRTAVKLDDIAKRFIKIYKTTRIVYSVLFFYMKL